MAGSILRKRKLVVPLVAVAVAACIIVVVLVRKLATAYEPPPIAFDGSSEKLANTVIVPTLDTPMPEDKNVVWCASFQLAWNEFRDDVIGEPVKITGAQAIAERLNTSSITAAILDPGDYYAKAGYVKEGAVDDIQKEMRGRFRDVETPQFDVDDPDLVAVMYAYLAANVKFTFRFYENQEAFRFDGVPVTSFGIGPNDHDVPQRLLDQIEVLYYSGDPYGPWSPRDEFIIDPCKHSEPYQVILARISPGATLAETVESLRTKLAENETSSFFEGEVFLAPNLHWRVTHRFRELEDKFLQNESHTFRWLEQLEQRIDFRLDRSGAAVRSQAWGGEEESAMGERRFLLNGPFLIVMRKRGAEEPFFVMWVDNPELLCKP